MSSKKTEQDAQKTATWIVAIIVLIVLYNIGGCGNSEDSSDKIESNEPTVSPREAAIVAQFSGWDGSHIKLEQLVKKAMNDPNSYEHDETRYGDRGDHLVVVLKYRGKNAYGGVVRGWVKAKVSLHDGTILEIIAEGP